MYLEKILENEEAKGLGLDHYHRRLTAKGFKEIGNSDGITSYHNPETNEHVRVTLSRGKAVKFHTSKSHSFDDPEAAMSHLGA